VTGNVRLLSSKEGFYVGFEVKETDVIGGFEKGAKDAHLWTKDAVEIMVDPDGDGDNLDYYEIQINPQGLVFASGGVAASRWPAGLQVSLTSNSPNSGVALVPTGAFRYSSAPLLFGDRRVGTLVGATSPGPATLNVAAST
jgi:hypothetical protein